jgi:hypothetical protein
LAITVALCVAVSVCSGLAILNVDAPAKRRAEAAELSAEFWRLTERLGFIHFPVLLGPDVIATPTGLSSVRALLSKYRSLLAQRRRVAEDYLRAAGAPTREGIAPRASAAGSASGDAMQFERTYRDLDERQALLADRVSAVLDWYGDRLPRTDDLAHGAASSGKDQEAELRRLRERVVAADNAVRDALQEAGRPPAGAPRRAVSSPA